MKKLLVAAAAFAAISSAPAVAADMAVKSAAVVAARPSCAQFGGFYLGVQGGGTAYNNSWQDKDAFRGMVGDDHQAADSISSDKFGWNAGVAGGYNYQTGCTVFGVEADWSWNGSNAGTRITLAGHNPINLTATDVSSDMRWFGTLRTRTGVVVDNVLIYVTGGLAYADFNRRYAFTSNTPITEVFYGSETKWGWTAGFGTEWSFSPNWSIKGDVLYMAFQKSDQTFRSTVFDPGFSYRFSNQDSAWVSRIGVNYRFGGPVVARY
jgi:outer membrane immunogenic protein